jgi:hypothetical protein
MPPRAAADRQHKLAPHASIVSIPSLAAPPAFRRGRRSRSCHARDAGALEARAVDLKSGRGDTR